MYFYNFKKPLNLHNPKDINEKLQFLKLRTYYDNPLITQCVDKFRVKEYLKNQGYGELAAELYDVADKSEDLVAAWGGYPKKFVIKCNHGCGFNIIVRDKASADLKSICRQLDLWMKEDFWKVYCEPQYKNVEKKIIVEQYLGDDIHAYKFYCFNGVPRVMYISSDGENGEKDYYLDYYDMEMKWLDVTLYPHEHSSEIPQKPGCFEEMKKLAGELSRPFPFVRVDLYEVEGKIYFSEFTFVPTGGNMKLSPKETLEEWGSWLVLDDNRI